MAPLLLCPVGRVSPRWRPRRKSGGGQGWLSGSSAQPLRHCNHLQSKGHIYLKDATQAALYPQKHMLHFTKFMRLAIFGISLCQTCPQLLLGSSKAPREWLAEGAGSSYHAAFHPTRVSLNSGPVQRPPSYSTSQILLGI